MSVVIGGRVIHVRDEWDIRREAVTALLRRIFLGTA